MTLQAPTRSSHYTRGYRCAAVQCDLSGRLQFVIEFAAAHGLLNSGSFLSGNIAANKYRRLFYRRRFCLERRVRHRHGGSMTIARDSHGRIKLPCQCLDKTGAKSGLGIAGLYIRLADTVVGNGQLPVALRDLVRNHNRSVRLRIWKCMLERIHDQFGHNQPDADGLARYGGARICLNFQRRSAGCRRSSIAPGFRKVSKDSCQ